MKRLQTLIAFIFLLSLGLSIEPLNAQDKTTLVYSLPKTEFIIEVQTEKVTQKPGVFYKYSERYLAYSDVLTKEKTSFRLKSISIKTRTAPDLKRTYNFVVNKGNNTIKLNVNQAGILTGINSPTSSRESGAFQTVSFPNNDTKSATLLPLSEEFMLAGSESKLAEGAAKQIYRIRERRLNLLTGDVDHLPTDGSSLVSMIQGMDKMESELTELFTGKTSIETSTHTIVLSPAAPVNNQILFRLSSIMGIVPNDDLSGNPFYISFVAGTIPNTPVDKKNAKTDNDGLFYIIPLPCQINITDGVKTCFTGHYLVPQFGKTVPISERLYEKAQAKVIIDEQTGRLLGVE
jgi:hypothetical protein